MQYLVCLAVFVACMSGTYAADLKPYNETALGMFISSDLNNDGIFTIDEIDQLFVKYDGNGDGRVTRHEYTVYIDSVTPTLHDLSHALYDEYDSDNDHHLDQHDYDIFFKRMDVDGDGIVSQGEFISFWEMLFTNIHEHLHGHGHGK